MRIRVYSEENGTKQFLYSIGYYASLYEQQRGTMRELAKGIFARKFKGRKAKKIIAERVMGDKVIVDRLL